MKTLLREFFHPAGPAAGRARLWALALAMLWVAAPAWAEPRTALVIGNGAYREAPLKNPANDARDIAAKLRELGFQVIERLDVDRPVMRQALREFEQRLREQRGVGLFYYAGHGVQLKGQNYLIPVGVDIRQEFEVPDEAVDAEAVLRAMESAGNELNIVILDACRNNPFTRGFGPSGRGLARMDGPAGTFIAYATAPGAISQDGQAGRNSPYTRSLLAAMSVPGLSLEQVFKQVLVTVERETGGAQIPWVASSLRGEFYFSTAVPGPSSPSASSWPNAAPGPQTPAPPVPIDGQAGEKRPPAASSAPLDGAAAEGRCRARTDRRAKRRIRHRPLSGQPRRLSPVCGGHRSRATRVAGSKKERTGPGHLAGGDGLRCVVIGTNRSLLPVTDRGGVGACLPGGCGPTRYHRLRAGMDLLGIPAGL
ncbi:MAG: caspase family protein [Candidatus Competibacter sp.]